MVQSCAPKCTLCLPPPLPPSLFLTPSLPPSLSYSYEEFLQQTHHLNSLETYPQLTSRAERIGFRVTKVVYCGYTASKALQNTHDTAIETRTRLKLEKESSEQEQNLREFKLKREKERSKLSEPIALSFVSMLCGCDCCVVLQSRSWRVRCRTTSRSWGG